MQFRPANISLINRCHYLYLPWLPLALCSIPKAGERLIVDKSNGAPTLAVEFELADTGSDIYHWAPAEELTPAGYPQTYTQGNRW